jgi:hypothetical protein
VLSGMWKNPSNEDVAICDDRYVHEKVELDLTASAVRFSILINNLQSINTRKHTSLIEE